MYAARFDAAVDCYTAHRYEEAASALRILRAEARAAGDEAVAADAAYQLGNVLRTLSAYPDATEMFTEALEYAVRRGSRSRQADCHLGLGNVHRGSSRYAAARAAYAAADSIYAAEGVSEGCLDVAINVAVVDYLTSDYAQAQRRFETLLSGRTPALDPDREMVCRANLANVLRERGRFAEAEALLDQARAFYEHIGNPIAVADCDLNLGNVYYQTGRDREAGRAWRRARTVFNNAALRERGADCTINLGLLALDQSETRLAIRRFDNARVTYAGFGLVEHTADCISDIGFAHLVDGDPRQAVVKFAEAQRHYREHQLAANPDWTAAMGEARRRQGKFRQARKHFRQAREAYLERSQGFDIAHMQMCQAQVLWEDARAEPDPRLRARLALRSAVPALLTTDDVRFQFFSPRDRAAWARVIEDSLAFVLDVAYVVGDTEVIGDLVESFTSVGWYAVGPAGAPDAPLRAHDVSAALRRGERIDDDDPRAILDDLVLPLLPAPPLRVLGPAGPRVALGDYGRSAQGGKAARTPLVTW